MYEDLTFVFDVDGTLCPIKKENERYEDVVPYREMVERIREYKAGGARIVLLTSRNMNTYNGNIGLINVNTARVLLDWLDRWEIPYDEIIYGKPWPGHRGFYVDDRTVRPSEFLTKSVDELDEIVRRDRCR